MDQSRDCHESQIYDQKTRTITKLHGLLKPIQSYYSYQNTSYMIRHNEVIVHFCGGKVYKFSMLPNAKLDLLFDIRGLE